VSRRTRYLATTLALLAIGLGFGLSQWRARPAAVFKPPVRDARVPAHPAQPPTAGEVLSRAEALQRERRAAHSRHAVETLTDAQRDALRREPVNAVRGRA
jgi:hypothetical protein